MNRRNFIKSSSLLALPLILKSCDWKETTHNYPILVNSDAATGHLIRESMSFEKVKIPAVKTLIVGGGIAGISAAYQLRNDDFLLCELSNGLGGTSSKDQIAKTHFAQGAHYDLAYPDYYGEEVLTAFQELDIVKPLPWRNAWGFTNEHHIIAHRRKNHCYDNGVHRKDVLEEGVLKDQFLNTISPFLEQMKLPSRLIDQKLHHLNQIDFLSYLNEKLTLNPDFIKGLDYHMKDDYGGEADKVSALAGIHYFMCRPYYNEVVELFSPPEGNYYFVDKMVSKINEEQLLTQHLVKHIREVNDGFIVEIIDVENRIIKVIEVNKVIYAGNKHALKFIYPEDYSLFAENIYSPWLVVNVVVDNGLPTPAFWQNEMLTNDVTLMGFVDSATQHKQSGEGRTLTAYYCLPPSSREDLINVEVNKTTIASSTINYISEYFDVDITSKVKSVSMKAMGHAMPMPTPGYLFDDKNQYRKNKNIVYAGVDNSRLPLLYEAVDSGIMAVKRISVI